MKKTCKCTNNLSNYYNSTYYNEILFHNSFLLLNFNGYHFYFITDITYHEMCYRNKMPLWNEGRLLENVWKWSSTKLYYESKNDEMNSYNYDLSFSHFLNNLTDY